MGVRVFPSSSASACPFAALLLVALLSVACSHVVYQPAPVIPTKSPLPFSAKVKITEVASYMVEPGATMVADPRIENRVTGTSGSVDPAKKQWEKSIADYLVDRKTFTYVSLDSQADLDLTLRLNIYIDPGVLFKFNHVYVARIDASLVSPRSGQTIGYMGYGKAPGEVSRGGAADDRAPINQAVQGALNDLFEKIEQDPRLRR